MRQASERAGLKHPAYRLLKTEAELARVEHKPGLPAIVKPVDNQSGRGVTLVTNRDALPQAFRHAMAHSREGSILIEAAVQGMEIIVDGFMLDGGVHVLDIAIKTPHPEQPTVSARITYGEHLAVCAAERIAAVNRRMLAALGLKSGVFHAEYMLSGED